MTRPRRAPVRVGLGAAVAFAVLTLLVALDWSPLRRLDRDLSTMLVCSPGSAWAHFWTAVSTAGQPLVFQVLAVAWGLGLVLDGRRRIGTFVALTVPGASLLSNAVKALVDRTRPATDGLIVDAHGSSYPSGHAITSWVAAGVVVLVVHTTAVRVRVRIRAVASLVAGAVAVLVASSRLALGVHYASDVLGAWLAGTAWVATAWLVAKPQVTGAPVQPG